MFRRGRPVDGDNDGFVYDGTIAQRPYVPLPNLVKATPARDSLGADGRMPTYQEALAADPELVAFLTRAWTDAEVIGADVQDRETTWTEVLAGSRGVARKEVGRFLRDPNPAPEAVRFLQLHRRVAKARLRDRDTVTLYRGTSQDPLESYDHVTGLGDNRAKGAPVLSWTTSEAIASRWGDKPYRVDMPVDNILSWNTYGNQSEVRTSHRPLASRGDEILAATNPEVIRRIERGDAPFIRETDQVTLPDPVDPTGTLVDRVLTEGGFTVDTTDGDSPTTGYIVAIPGYSFIATREAFEADGRQQIRDYVRAIREDRAFRDQYGEVMFGGWHDTEHDEVVLDRVEHFASREDAIAAGMARNEQAIWDVAAGAEIPTGGTGGREDVDIVGEAPTLTGRWRRLPDPLGVSDEWVVAVDGNAVAGDVVEVTNRRGVTKRVVLGDQSDDGSGWFVDDAATRNLARQAEQRRVRELQERARTVDAPIPLAEQIGPSGSLANPIRPFSADDIRGMALAKNAAYPEAAAEIESGTPTVKINYKDERLRLEIGIQTADGGWISADEAVERISAPPSDFGWHLRWQRDLALPWAGDGVAVEWGTKRNWDRVYEDGWDLDLIPEGHRPVPRPPTPQTPADMVQVLGTLMGDDPLELGSYNPRNLEWIRSFRPLASDDDLTAALDAAVAEGVVEEVGVDGERRWRLPRPPHVVVRDEAMAARNAGAVPVLARVADNRMKRGGLNKGDVVPVEFVTAHKAKVTIETSNGKRSYRVQWDRFEPVPDGWEPPVERDESFNKFFDPARQAEVVAEVADVLRRIPNRHDPDAALAAVNARYPGLVEAAEGGTAEHAATVAGVLARAAMRVEFDAPNGPPVETLVNTDFGDYVESMAASQLPGLRLLESDEIQAYQLDELVDATMGESPLMARMAEAYGWPVLTNISIPNADVGGFTVHEALNIRAGASAIGINVDGDYPDGPSDFGPVDRSALSVIVDRSRRGVVRHEYGHFMDAVLVNVGIVDGGSPTSRRAARRAVIRAFELDWPTSAMRQVSRYAGSSHSELLAEGWTAISHPDYPAWKLTLTNRRDLERWNLMESYFNPDGVPFYPWNETVLPVPEPLAPNPPVPVPTGDAPVPVPTGGTP